MQEIKQLYDELKNRWALLLPVLKKEEKEIKRRDLEAITMKQGLWDDSQNARLVMKAFNNLNDTSDVKPA